MDRRTIIIAACALLIGLLRGPLCAAFCLDGWASASVLEGVHDSPAQTPCHDREAPSTLQIDSPRSHSDCGCDGATGFLVEKAAVRDLTGPVALVPECGHVFELAPSVFPPVFSLDFAQRAPPPDILLLKSTLLI